MSSFVRERIHYEIAMSIGNSQDLGAMLKEGLSTYLRKLNCLAGAVLQSVQDDDGRTSFETVYAIPKRMKRNSAVVDAIENVPTGIDGDALASYMATLPVRDEIDGLKRYLMELPGFGLLLLVKSAPGLSMPELKSLAPLNLKLAGACISCAANERLQKEIEEREKAEEKYRSIFNNAVEGIYQTTLDGRLLHANPAMARLLGFASPEEAIAGVSNIKEELYVNPGDRERMLGRLNRKGKISGYEFEYVRQNGTHGWMSISARLINDDSGAPIIIEGTADDVTPKKQALISLREAKQEAERLSQMKSNFLSMVSHELRTPLTAILGFAKITRKRMSEILASDSACPPDVNKRLGRIGSNTDVIIAEGERLTELINNVLDLAKLEAGSFEWHMNDVSMKLVLSHSLAATEVLFSGTDVCLEYRVDENLPAVSGDHDRLIQVVINLLSNAAKFTLEGKVELSATVESGNVVVRVADTGIGVPEDEVAVIFDKFRQLGNTLTDKPKGSGLGLPICKEIIEFHNGRIWFEPGEGGGSVFAFSIPVKAD